MGNSIGKLFNVTSFGESHGQCVGVIVDGCPAGLAISKTDIQKEVDRRRASQSIASTGRREEDRVEILSGVFNGFTSGAPICLLIRNQDVDSSDYERIKHLLRPSHADHIAFVKYGGFNDYRGGGMFSGRITVTYVMAGAIARRLLRLLGIEILAHTVEIGGIKASSVKYEKIKSAADKNPLRCADPIAAAKMAELI